MRSTKRLKLPDDFVQVQILEAKPNPMFSEEQRQTVRFLRYSKHVRCAECGKKQRTLWTSTFTFVTVDIGVLVPIKSGKRHPPLTPICTDHCMAPALDPPPQAKVVDDGKGGRSQGQPLDGHPASDFVAPGRSKARRSQAPRPEGAPGVGGEGVGAALPETRAPQLE